MPADGVDVEMAESVVGNVGRWITLSQEVDALRSDLADTVKEQNSLHNDTRQVQELMAALMQEAGVSLPLATQGHDLVAPIPINIAAKSISR